jgi:hypothetical protein
MATYMNIPFKQEIANNKTTRPALFDSILSQLSSCELPTVHFHYSFAIASLVVNIYIVVITSHITSAQQQQHNQRKSCSIA